MSVRKIYNKEGSLLDVGSFFKESHELLEGIIQYGIDLMVRVGRVHEGKLCEFLIFFCILKKCAYPSRCHICFDQKWLRLCVKVKFEGDGRACFFTGMGAER